MSLDEWMKSKKKEEKENSEPKSSIKQDIQKKEKNAPLVKKKPQVKKKNQEQIEQDNEENLDNASNTTTPAIQEPVQSALKAIGLVKYVLTCAPCKYKKELLIPGEPKAHQIVCKKCGGTMKVMKKT